MRKLSIYQFIFLSFGFCLGCSDQSSTVNPPAPNRKSASQQSAPFVRPKPLDDVLAANPGLFELIAAQADQRDANGKIISIALYQKEMKLSDLAELDEAPSIKRLHAGHAKLTDDDMTFLPKLASLEKLEFNVNTEITDASLEHLSGLKKLRILSLFFCPKLTGEGFVHLDSLDNLVILDIGNNKEIKDENLKFLKDLDRLQILNASPLWGLTDKGLVHLSQIKSLKRLKTRSKLITNEGIQCLASLKDLEILQLSGSPNLTAEGIEKLQKALPNCRIVN